MNLLSNPNIFNYTILTLYTLNSIRWGYERNWAQASYWFGALWITATVTFLME